MIEDPRTPVRALLAAAGIAPPEAEVEQMIAGYPSLRAAADGLYLAEVDAFAPAFLPSDGDDDGEDRGGARDGDRSGATTRGGVR
jgi:hypothetical protein